MATPRQLSRDAVAAEPWLLWNAFVDMAAMENLEDLTDTQRVGALVFWYDSEVNNGGHLQYFENRGVDDVPATIDALRTMSATQHADVLKEALDLWQSKERQPIDTVDDYVAEALELEFEKADEAFGDANPDLEHFLQEHLRANETEYVSQR